MAKKLSEEDVAMWQQRIDNSREWRKPEEEKWKRFIGYAQNRFDKMGDPNYIAVNLVHAHVRIIIPAVYSKNPDIIVQPRQKSAVESAKVMEHYLRYLIKEAGLKGEMKLCVLDTVLTGHSWMKTGYRTDFAKSTEKLPVVQRVFDQLSKMFTGEEDYDESTFILEPDERIVAEQPWALRISPFDIFVPAFSSSRFELPWISHQYVRRLKDAKENPEYKNNKNLKPSTRAVEVLQNKVTGRMKSLKSADEHEEYVLLHEIWDCAENCIYIIAEDNEKPLQVKQNPFTFLDSRHTFEMLGFNFIPDQFYPISEIEPWEPQMEELNQIRTSQSVHRKRFNRKYVYASGEFKPEAIEALEKGGDGTMVPTDAEDVRAAITPIMDAPLSNDVYIAEKNIKEDITNIGGITDYQRGSQAQGAKTATEASIVESQSRFRTEERLDTVGDFAQRIIRNLGMIAQNFLDSQQLFPVLGDDAVFWVKMNKRQIQGEMLYEVVYASTAATNRDVDKQQYLQAYEMLSQDPLLDPLMVRTEFLRKVLGVIDPIRWLRPDVAAMMKQAEMQAIQDAMAAGGGTPGAEGGGNGTGQGVGQLGDKLATIRRALNVRTPGGVGGGRMNGQ